MSETPLTSHFTRRRFLAGSSAVAGVVALAACSDDNRAADGTGDSTSPGASDSANTMPPDNLQDWASVRDQFSIAAGPNARFDAFVLASHPRPVSDAIERHRAGLDADGELYVEQEAVAGGDQAVIAAAADYLDADPLEIALTQSTTMGLGLLYGGLRVRADQRVLVTEHDFYSTHQSWLLRSTREGIAVDRVALYTDPAAADTSTIVGNLIAAVTPATRVVSITWVHSGTGVKLPVAEIAAALAELNVGRAPEDRALLCVDGIHGFGIEDATAADLGCDFLVSGTHKWLFGPRGTGIVWGAFDAWQHVDTSVPAFESRSLSGWINGDPIQPTTADSFSPGGTHSYEHRWAVADAFAFHKQIGKDRIAAYTHEQATRLKQGLLDVPGVRVVTPQGATLSAGIVCVDVEGVRAFEAVERLTAGGFIASSTPYRESFLRFGPSMVTTSDQVDALVDELKTW